MNANLQLNKRENLAQYFETQAYWCKVIADKLRNGEDVSKDRWTVDVFSSQEWEAEMNAIAEQERLNHECEKAIEGAA